MAFDEMDIDLAMVTDRVTMRHLAVGTPVERAWPEVVRASKRAIGPEVVAAALKLPITDGLATCISEYSALLGRDNKTAAKGINGLWFGLVELTGGKKSDDSIWVPYISGSKRFSAKDDEWPVGPEWMPEDRWAQNAPMNELSKLRRKHPRRAWYIEVCLISSLHTLYVGQFVRTAPASVLLGSSKSRGIGCGFDDGDLVTIGVVTAKGFVPSKSKG